MNANKRIETGISIREIQVRKWLRERRFSGEYLLVSTKPESEWSERLRILPQQTFLIVDLYTPVLLEKALTFRAWNPMDWMIREKQREMVRGFLKRGSHFLVANRRQREYWIEEAKTLGIVLKKSDISVLPTGSPLHPSSFILHPSERRRVVLWFGGIYPWMNPELLVHAFGRVHQRFPNWTLRIMGGFQPDTGYEHRYHRVLRLARKTIDAEQLHIVDWKNATAMHQCLTDAAFAVHLVKHTPEDYYAHRVRLLTLLSFGIGVLTSGHDVISDLLVGMRTGERVKGNVEHVAEALDSVMTSDQTTRAWRKRAPIVQVEFFRREQDRVELDRVLLGKRRHF